MKKRLTQLAICIAVLSMNSMYSQEQKIQPCNTYAALEELFIASPDAKERYEKNQKNLQNAYIDSEKNAAFHKTSSAFQYTIPVVFHILHQGGSENISDAACIAALNQVNSDYAAAGSDFNTIFSPFKSLYINSDIKFMLAHKDPNGNCTSGIVRHYDARTNWSQSAFGTNYTGITWDPTKYLNVIIVKQIVPSGTVTGNGIIVGYTYPPGSWSTGASQDAIVYNYSFLSGLSARSLSHEIGHWLSLAHTFGSTNNPGVTCGSSFGGDGVSDTPDTKGNFGACPASSTNTAYTCTSPNPTNSANYYQNVENIMDYSSCPKNFTTGQTTKMRAALGSSTAGRNNLSSTTNLITTDVYATSCPIVADYVSTTSYTVCSGGSLLVKDQSFSAIAASYSWAANNGAVIASPNASNTSISFPNPGIVNVTLTLSNNQGTNSVAKQITVVNSQASITGPFMESFETPNVVPANWSVVNPNGVGWDQTNMTAIDGSYCYYIDNTSAAGEQDYLVMPIMDVLNNANDSIKFSYAYARKSSTQNDKLVFQGSKDCGGTWIDIVSLGASTMANGSGGVTATPFVPGPSQWKEVNTFNYPQWFQFTIFQSALFRFVFTEDPASGSGNRIFIDAVNFTGPAPTGLNKLIKTYKLSLFPNPTNEETNLKFTLNDASDVSVNVVDVLGKNVLPTINNYYNAGEQVIAINKNNTLARGVYFVNVSINGTKLSKKLVVN